MVTADTIIADTSIKALPQGYDDTIKRLESRVIEESEKLRLREELLIQQSKLASMGQMIATIAHQWRQPLNNLALLVQDLRDAFDFGQLDKNYLESTIAKSMDQIQFMSKTIDDFRNFYRPPNGTDHFDVQVSAARVLSMFSNYLKNNSISYRLTCHAHNRTFTDCAEVESCDRMFVSASENELKQVMLNIITNAKESIMEKRSANLMRKDEEGLITIDFYNEGDKVIIKTGDNGMGFHPNMADRLFGLDFSTKGDNGTGLGLYMSKIIVETRMGGKIYAQSKDPGAEFTIELPLK